VINLQPLMIKQTDRQIDKRVSSSSSSTHVDARRLERHRWWHHDACW